MSSLHITTEDRKGIRLVATMPGSSIARDKLFYTRAAAVRAMAEWEETEGFNTFHLFVPTDDVLDGIEVDEIALVGSIGAAPVDVIELEDEVDVEVDP